MDYLNLIISENLKKLREVRKLSLEKVSKLTGVSKSMLGQIERGEVNPTVSTIWKISNGLKISFTQLMSRPELDIEHIDQSEIQPLIEDDGKIRNYPVFPFDSTRRFEMYSIEIDDGGNLNADAHPLDTQEFISVFTGTLLLQVNGVDYTVHAGNSIKFKADVPHTYKNITSTMCTLSMVIYYPI